MLDGLLGKRSIGLNPRPAGAERHNCEKPGNARQPAAVFSHRMHHNLPDLDTANR